MGAPKKKSPLKILGIIVLIIIAAPIMYYVGMIALVILILALGGGKGS